MELSDVPPLALLVLGTLLGLLFGSFTNVVIYRLPRGENVAFPASHCPGCGTPIKAYDNLPLVSFLWLRGRARCCKAPIPWRYFCVELLGGLWALAVVRVILLDLPLGTGLGRVGLLFAVYLALGLILLAAIFIDLEHMILPDELTLGGAALGLLSAGLRDIGYATSVIGAALGFLMVWLPFISLYRLVRGRPGMGLGDAKLLLLTGAWFGWKGALFALLVGSVQGTLFAVPVFLARGRLEEPESVRAEREQAHALLGELEGAERDALAAEIAADPLLSSEQSGLGKARLAFGPFLALATLEYLFFGEYILDLYLRWAFT